MRSRNLGEGGPDRPGGGSIFEKLAVKFPRRSFFGAAGKAFAWLVGVKWVAGSAMAFEPPSRAIGVMLLGVPPPGGTTPVYGAPARPPGAGGPPPNPAYGSKPGNAWPHTQGMYGCDCFCMYGANACPGGSGSPGGAWWCYCIDMDEGGTGAAESYVCYGDCFGATPTNCVNAYGRNCGSIGSRTNAMAHRPWPDLPAGSHYVCTLALLVSINPTTWFATYTPPGYTYRGTYIKRNYQFYVTAEPPAPEPEEVFVLPPEFANEYDH